MERPASRAFPRSACSRAELERLFDIASLYRATGAICDVGCGNGGSTYALAEGLRSAGYRPEHQIEAYDWFELGEGPHSKYATQTQFWDNLSDNADYVKLYAVDLQERSTLDPKPAEILFIDAAKSNELSLRIHQRFLSRLSSNGILLNQDFGMPSLPWIHCSFSILSNYAKSIDFVDDMIILEMQNRLPQKAITQLVDDRFSINERHEFIESWQPKIVGKVDASGESYDSVIDLSHAFAELCWGDVEAGVSIAKKLENKPHTQRFQRYIENFHAKVRSVRKSGFFRRLWSDSTSLFRRFKALR